MKSSLPPDAYIAFIRAFIVWRNYISCLNSKDIQIETEMKPIYDIILDRMKDLVLKSKIEYGKEGIRIVELLFKDLIVIFPSMKESFPLFC